jgi:hypothetical protein
MPTREQQKLRLGLKAKQKMKWAPKGLTYTILAGDKPIVAREANGRSPSRSTIDSPPQPRNHL